jgi:hypothetical protein
MHWAFLEAPVTNQDGSISKGDIEIPLISLVSHSPSKMKKFDLKIDIQAFVKNEELIEIYENVIKNQIQ